jgi:hypothetical protein
VLAVEDYLNVILLTSKDEVISDVKVRSLPLSSTAGYRNSENIRRSHWAGIY